MAYNFQQITGAAQSGGMINVPDYIYEQSGTRDPYRDLRLLETDLSNSLPYLQVPLDVGVVLRMTLRIWRFFVKWD